MKITSIITSKNRKYETRRALDSVYTQTRKSDEVILVLDHCADNTAEYLSHFDYPGLRIISVPLSDISSSAHARNIGIKNATGDYIAFLDSDDCWLPSKLAVFEEYLKKEPIADIICSDVNFHNKGAVCLIPHLELCSSEILRKRAYCWNICFASASMYSKRLFVEAGGFDENLKTQCDWEFLLRCLSKTELNISYVSTPLTDMWVMYNSGCFDVPGWKNEYNEILHKNKGQIISDGSVYQALSVYESFFRGYLPEGELMKDFIAALDNDTETVQQILEAKQKEIENAKTELSKKQSFYVLMRNWVKLYQSGTSLADILRKHDVSEVAVYGYGAHGRMLMEDLQRGKITVKYVIDNKVQSESGGIPVFHTGQNLPDVEMVIVTPYLERNSIVAELQKIVRGTIVDLEQLVNNNF